MPKFQPQLCSCYFNQQLLFFSFCHPGFQIRKSQQPILDFKIFAPTREENQPNTWTTLEQEFAEALCMSALKINRPVVQQSATALGSQTTGFFIPPHLMVPSDFLKVTKLLLSRTRKKGTRQLIFATTPKAKQPSQIQPTA